MADELKGHKTDGRLNPYKSRYLRDLIDSKVPLRQILTNLRNRNGIISTTIKHIYDACHWYMQYIRGPRIEMHHLLISLFQNKYVYNCKKYFDSYYVKYIL